MATEFDESDFVDRDFQAAQKSAYDSPSTLAPGLASGQNRPPTREELDTRVSETHQRLADLKRAQEQLERERAALEEARRRRVELQTGREEMQHHLTRGLGLLEEAEFAARRDAEQMTKTIADFREALAKVQAIHEETWTQDNWNVELTRALTTIENARMEWNSARLKWPVLDRDPVAAENPDNSKTTTASRLLEARSFGELCKLGLALTWPLAAVALVALAIFVVILLRR